MSRIVQVKSFPETPLMTYWESGQTKSEGWSCIGYDGDGGSYFDSFGFGDKNEESEPLVTFIGPEKDKRGGNGNAGKRRLILVTGGKKGGSDQ